VNTDKYGQMIYNAEEVFDILMHDINPGLDVFQPGPFIMDDIDVDIANEGAGYNALLPHISDIDLTVEEFDKKNQKDWFMPQSYKEMDIAEHVLSLCDNQEELQRCGEELIMYQERDLFDLLRYMKYLVDVMELNSVIWGVGRGSSVSSFVLFKLRVHKINSLFYKLAVTEFLR
jgi:DNA polymerase III alpha subunit